MNWVLISIFGYIVVQVVVCGLFLRKMKNEKDYFLAGRSLGIGLVTFSIFATWFGAETCIGSSAEVFQKGLSGARTDPLGYTVCLLFMGFFLASRLWKKNLITLGDLFRTRYSKSVEIIGVLIMIPSSLMWAAAQIRGFGQIISASSTFHVEAAIGIAALLTIAYTMMGGLLADVFTDLIQGIVLIIGLIIVLFSILHSVGDPVILFKNIDPSRLQLFTHEFSPLRTLELWVSPILASLVCQEMISRIIAARAPTIAKQSCFIAASIYIVIGFIPVILGILGPQLLGHVPEHEQFFALLAKKYLTTPLYILFVGALISAILSTVDSALLAVASLVSHNLVFPVLKNASEAHKVFIARTTVVIAGIVAYIIAINSSGIYELIEGTASTVGTAGIFVIAMFGLFTDFGNKESALGALIASCVAMPLAKNIFHFEAPYLISLTVSLVTYVVIGIYPYFLRVLEATFGQSSQEVP